MSLVHDFLVAITVLMQTLFGVVPPVELRQPPLPNVTSVAIVTAVIDGDTIDVRIGSSTAVTRVRYIGIDTPEPYREGIPECGSLEATERNSTLVSGQLVTIVSGAEPYDKYDRLLAYVYVGDVFVNETLLSEGWADLMLIAPNTNYRNQFTLARNQAKTARVGMWGLCP